PQLQSNLTISSGRSPVPEHEGRSCEADLAIYSVPIGKDASMYLKFTSLTKNPNGRYSLYDAIASNRHYLISLSEEGLLRLRVTEPTPFNEALSTGVAICQELGYEPRQYNIIGMERGRHLSTNFTDGRPGEVYDDSPWTVPPMITPVNLITFILGKEK